MSLVSSSSPLSVSAWLHCPGGDVNEAPVILMSVCLGHFQPSVFESSSQLLLNLFAQNLSEKNKNFLNYHKGLELLLLLNSSLRPCITLVYRALENLWTSQGPHPITDHSGFMGLFSRPILLYSCLYWAKSNFVMFVMLKIASVMFS